MLYQLSYFRMYYDLISRSKAEPNRGQWWIRTTVGLRQLSYSQPHLATLVTAPSVAQITLSTPSWVQRYKKLLSLQLSRGLTLGLTHYNINWASSSQSLPMNFQIYRGIFLIFSRRNGEFLRTYHLILPKFHLILPKNYSVPPWKIFFPHLKNRK